MPNHRKVLEQSLKRYRMAVLQCDREFWSACVRVDLDVLGGLASPW